MVGGTRGRGWGWGWGGTCVCVLVGVVGVYIYRLSPPPAASLEVGDWHRAVRPPRSSATARGGFGAAPAPLTTPLTYQLQKGCTRRCRRWRAAAPAQAESLRESIQCEGLASWGRQQTDSCTPRHLPVLACQRLPNMRTCGIAARLHATPRLAADHGGAMR